MALYSARDYAVIFDLDARGADVLTRGVVLNRTRSVWCGDMLYVSVYPIWDTRAEITAARTALKKSSAAQARLNLKNAQLRLEQLANCNFGAGDLFMSCTYADDAQPETDKQARKDAQNFIRRLRGLRRRLGLPELKYIYVTEITHGARGVRYHHHMLLSGDGMNRDEVEALWKKGLVNSKRCQRLDSGVAGISCYMTKLKDTQTKLTRRKWCSSKNLKQPRVTYADHKLSARKIERIARDIEQDGRAIFQKAFKGYRVIEDIVIRRSEYVAGAYIYCRMRKND